MCRMHCRPIRAAAAVQLSQVGAHLFVMLKACLQVRSRGSSVSEELVILDTGCSLATSCSSLHTHIV